MLNVPFDYQPRTSTIFGPGSFARLPSIVQAHGMRRVLIVSDPGIAKTGISARAVQMLWDLKVDAFLFQDFGPNPDTAMAQKGRDYAWPLMIDSIIGLGGGSSMDMAKAINFLLTNGGEMKDYKGHGKTTRPMYPMIGIPTTAGTGSEAQSYCIISDAETHMKMACGDPQAAFRVAVLDPELTLSQPVGVAAAAGYDAISHAVESFVSTRRTPLSRMFAREAFRLMDGAYEKVLNKPEDIEARGAMLLGAHYAGMSIEGSMLGATHACSNPVTAHYGVAHGEAIATMLHHVVRWNRIHQEYLQLRAYLPERLRELAQMAGLPGTLREAGVPDDSLFETMAAEAAEQWTGKHNPRAFDAAGAMEIYRCAL